MTKVILLGLVFIATLTIFVGFAPDGDFIAIIVGIITYAVVGYGEDLIRRITR